MTIFFSPKWAFDLAKMGVKYDEIIKHYYTGVDLTKAY